MSKSRLKKQYERFLLERFLEAANLAGQIVDDEGEAPDFIVRIERERIGMEVTELFISSGGHNGNLQAQESLADRIVASAYRLYSSFGGRHAHVSVLFAAGGDLRDLNRDETSSALANFVKAQALVPGQLAKWHQDYVSSSLPDIITYVSMLGVPTPGMARWTTIRAGWIAPMTGASLQARIDEKIALLPTYRLRVATNWLVLVSDGSKPSQFFDAPTPAIASAVSSPFARTFYFGRFKGTVIELGLPLK